MATEVTPLPVAVYEPPRGWFPGVRWRELWEYRELLYFLTWRDIKVRYKQTALGVAWAVLQPLLTMVIFSVIFGQLAKLPSDGIPYPVFSYAALLPWQLFSGALSRAGSSLVTNRNLLTKVYFPRLIIPFSAVAAGLVDFGISFIVLLGLMLFYGITPTWAILTLPFLVLLALLTALAVGLWLSALNVQYRDVRTCHPVSYSGLDVCLAGGLLGRADPTGFWRIIYGLNPLAGVIQGFRWALLGAQPPDMLFLVSVVVVIVLLVTGLFYFQTMEESFADVV